MFLSLCVPLINQNGWTALFWEIYDGNDKCLHLLLAAGADINISDNVYNLKHKHT